MAKPVIFSTPTCPYCIRAKALFDDIGVEYEEKNVLENQEEHAALAEKHSWQTVPMIFIGDEFIGGYDDLAKLQAEGSLQEKLDA